MVIHWLNQRTATEHRGATLPLDGHVLAPGEVLVVAHSSASDEIKLKLTSLMLLSLIITVTTAGYLDSGWIGT